MGRPPCCRRIQTAPTVALFKPAGIPVRHLEEVVLSLDGLEALRLADLEGLYQEEAAARMNVSRATFGRIVEAARRAAAEALVHGKALRIEGGVVSLAPPTRNGAGDEGCGRRGHGDPGHCCGRRRSSP
jgi:predicted DNA-binding protein (UPF0251 family)